MKSVVLIPYCPLPADHGGKMEMLKVLETLRELGECTILSARTLPVGTGWTKPAIAELESRGFRILFREDDEPRRLRPLRWLGLLYAVVCKALRLEKAFGHANPYHRFAFDPRWVAHHSESADLAVFVYSFWAGFPTKCPKVVALLDVWSDFMWGGHAAETRDLRSAGLVVVISQQEQERLRARGIERTLWSPPFVDAVELPDSERIGMIGSANAFNREGLRWLGEGITESPIRVYGGLAAHVGEVGFERVGRYHETMDPYRECGIILMTTIEGMGVQIKTIEALAAGRAIIARRGAMRGIPTGDGAWIEVDSPSEMRDEAMRLQRDVDARRAQMEAARAYYRRHLDVGNLRAKLKASLVGVAAEKGRAR